MWAVAARARTLRHDQFLAERPTVVFPGQIAGFSELVPLDDGRDIFRVRLYWAVEYAARWIAHLSMKHGYADTTIKFIRADTSHCVSGQYAFKVEWRPCLADEDSDSADWWKI